MKYLKQLCVRFRNRLSRPISVGCFALMLSLATLVLYHIPLFSYISENIESGFSGVLIFVSVATIMVAVNYMVYYLALYVGRIVGRYVVALLFVGNALCLYFIDSYEVLITREMMGNVFNTRFSEASGFFSFGAVSYVVLLGVLPAIYVVRRKVDYGSFRRLAVNIVASLLIVVGVGAANMQNVLWIDRNATSVGSLIMPWSYTVNSIRYFHHKWLLNREAELLPDATISDTEREVVVLVIGESARRDHFSLYGYERTTNPLLADDGVVALVADASATFTTAGVKAILDHRPTDELYETLPDYLYRTGVDVVWRSTNWGEPPLHIDNYYNRAALRNRYPEVDGRYDQLLVEGLAEEIEACDGPKVLIVLHSSTSHGPTYNEQYPSEFEQFTPVCTTVEMSKANRSELINAYDNTILYTDYLLHSVIEQLRTVECARSAMIYVSDHGESLGEGNRYMHGLPMSMAPREQYEIPFVVWCSDAEQTIKPLSKVGHYHVFHSVLNFLGVDSPIYDESRNIFE